MPLTYRGSVYVHQDFTESTEKCCNFCARLNHFLGVYGKNENYHPLCFFVFFVVVYFFSVDAFFMEKIAKQNCLFLAFFKKVKQVILFHDFLHEKSIDRKKQSTPRQRARKNEDDGSLHFFHRPPESGLILHRSCVIYDGGRPPEIVILSLFPWEMQNL